MDELPDELGVITSGSGNDSPAVQPGAVESISAINMNGVVDVPPLQKTIDPVLLKQQNQNLSQLLSGNSSVTVNNVTTNGNPPSNPAVNLNPAVADQANPNIKPQSIDNPMMINVMQQPQQILNNMNRPSLPMHQMQNNAGIISQMMSEQPSHQMSSRQQLDQMHGIRTQQTIHQQQVHYGQMQQGMNTPTQMNVGGQIQQQAGPGIPGNPQMVQGGTMAQPGHLQGQINSQMQQMTPQQQHLQQQQQMQMKMKVFLN